MNTDNTQYTVLCLHRVCPTSSKAAVTDELAAKLDPLPQVVHAENEAVDHAHEDDLVCHVVRSVELVHDDTEAVLLHLHALRGEGTTGDLTCICDMARLPL